MRTLYKWCGIFEYEDYEVEFLAWGNHWCYPETMETPEEDEWEVDEIDIEMVTRDDEDVDLTDELRKELEDKIENAILDGKYEGEVIRRSHE